MGLFVSDRHVAEDGSTVVLLGRGDSPAVWVRGVGAGSVLFATWFAIFLLAGVGGVALASLVLLALVGRALPSQWRDREARGRLRALRPAHARLMHSLARDPASRPGVGRALMVELHAIADAHGWTLVLEAANEHLAQYYQGLGWERLGSETLASGEELTAMVRRPGGRHEEAV
ncbi:MAG: GNAT family N-acetyltransferase [Actinomycetota bacterium]|nr:GNAT family N-acetyltransferase [Actinomycetota bacterium]